MQGNGNRIRTAPQGAFGKTRRGGIYVYTVQCVGLFNTVSVVIRLRSPTLYDVARNIARTMQKGALAYNVASVDRE